MDPKKADSASIKMADLVRLAQSARTSNDVQASALVKTAVEAIARSEAAATEARILAGFVNEM